MKILIAGGAGFIGHNLSVALETLGHSILIVDIQTDYGVIPPRDFWITTSNRQKFMSKNKLRAPVHENIKNTKGIARVIEKYEPDIIVNLAAFSRVKLVQYDPVMACDSLVKGVYNLLYGSQGIIKRFIHVSSSMVYGDWPSGGHFYGMREDWNQMQPKSDYGILKLASEGIVKRYCNEHNVEYTIVRPSAVYGPRDIIDRVVPKFLLQAANNETIYVNGDSSIDFTHMDDFIKGMVQCVLNDRAADETFNITRERSRTLVEAATVAIEVTNSNSQIKIAEHNEAFGKRGTCSNTKARNLLGYDPIIDIEEGFVDTWEWLRDKDDSFYRS